MPKPGKKNTANNIIVGGEERYTPDPGKAAGKTVVCATCGDAMGVEPDVEGYTSWASAMAGKKRKHDSFACPNIEHNWHKQVIKLRRFISDCPSAVISRMVEKEIREILKTRKGTKKVSLW